MANMSEIFEVQDRDDIYQLNDEIHDGLTTRGYKWNTFRLRNIEKECDHHNFKSSEQYLVNIRTMINNIQNRENLTVEQSVNMMNLIGNIGFGWCQNCALIITCNLPKLIRNLTEEFCKFLSIRKCNTKITHPEIK